jgi:aryl-alcohol dehydrogenase-like predicted oxidoreductase
VEQRRLGRTDHRSTVAILGGAAFARSNPEETELAFTDAIARGVNHLDIAPRYGDAETLVGPSLDAVRDQIFVACKTTRRNAGGVRAQLEESLTKLHTDRFDLYQMHAVTGLDVLEERVDAAAEILKARDEGVVRFAGITGHDLGAPKAFSEALRRWDLDTVMFPVNARMWADPTYRADAETLLDTCIERDIGVMAIKAAAKRPWDASDRFATTWYEPLTGADEIRRGVSFALSVPGVHAFCTPGDVAVLRTALDAAEASTPLDDAARLGAIDDAASNPSIFPMPVG